MSTEISAMNYEQAQRLWYYSDSKLYWKVKPYIGDKDSEAGSILNSHSGIKYLRVMYNNIMYPVQNLIWLLHNKQWPKKTVDHIDRNGLNNDISNLRLASPMVQACNRRTSLKIPGVYQRSSGTWYGCISIKGKKHISKHFKNKWDAICARKSFEINLQGETI